MEPEEMNEFSKQMEEAGEAGESLTKISLAISILAVLVAMVTVLGHRSHTEAVLSQSNANDMWNQYAAKKNRSYLVEGNDTLLRLQPNSNAAAVNAQLAKDSDLQKKWASDLTASEDKAHEFEADVKHAERQAGRYDLGEALLQIGVVLCSITLFTRRRLYFVMGLSLGVAGLVFAAWGLVVH